MSDSPGPQTAQDQMLAISEYLHIVGRDGATPEQVVKGTGLPADVVRRRLAGAGPQCPQAEWRRFGHDRLSGRWFLTAGGEQLLRASGRATTKGRKRLP